MIRFNKRAVKNDIPGLAIDGRRSIDQIPPSEAEERDHAMPDEPAMAA